MKRSLARTLLLFLLIATVSAAVGAAHYALRGGTLARAREGGSAFVATAQSRLGTLLPRRQKPAGIGQTGGILVYFAPAANGAPDRIDAAFLDFLRSARSSIYGAFYDFQWMDAARVLIEKRGEGVEVGLVCDSDYKEREAIQACIQSGIKVVFDGRSALMHNKFCIVDGQRVWTGSTNCTENCMYRNDNNSLAVSSEGLSANYTAEFREMFAQRKFGKGSPRSTPYPRLTVNDTAMACYFSPEDNVYKKIEAEIKTATTSIDFMAFSFTSRDLAEAMARRQRDGVKVRGLFDAQQAASRYSQDEYLAERGACVWLDRNPHTMHHKVIVVDAKTVLTGSYNFSKSAEEKNDENLLVIHSPTVARNYLLELERLTAN